MNFLAATLHQADEDVGQEACADTVRDGVGQGHEDDGHERGDTQTPVVPVNVHCLADHQEANEHHCGCNGFEGHNGDQRGQEDCDEEQRAGDDVREAGACARTDTGCGLHENLAGGGGSATADYGAEGVHEQDLVDVLDLAVLDGACFGCETDGGAHCVEERGDEDGEDQQNCSHAAEGAEGTEQVSGAEQGEVGQLAGAGVPDGDVQGPAGGGFLRAAGGHDLLQDDGEGGGGEHAVEDCTLHIADEQRNGEEQAEEEDEGGPAEQVAAHAEGDGHGGACCVGHAADNTCVNEADEGDEEADTDDDCDLERFGDRVEHCGAETGQHEDGHQHTSPDDEAHDGGPGQVGGGGDGGCQQCVHAEACRHGEGLLGDDAHEDGHDACDQCGHCCDLRYAKGVAGCVLAEADDEGVQHDDVAHREEGGEAAAEFGGDGGASLSDLEVTVQCALGFRLGVLGSRGVLRRHS